MRHAELTEVETDEQRTDRFAALIITPDDVLAASRAIARALHRLHEAGQTGGTIRTRVPYKEMTVTHTYPGQRRRRKR